ncbi:MAG: hypothetical protein Q4C22_07090, partial [Bacillota bacterium]|nr:hypothetical protein [Bacillota bacterium]
MRTKKQRVLSWLLTLCMVVSLFAGLSITASAADAPTGYTTDEHGVMAYRYKYSDKTFDIKGYFAGAWKRTTYSDGGYVTYLKVESGEPAIVIPSDALEDDSSTGLSVAIRFDFRNEGKTLQILYDVKNTTDTAITFSLGCGSDVQIG